MNRNIYSLAAVEKAAEKLAADGYAVEVIEGALLDNMIFFPADPARQYYFVAEVVPLSEWNSAYIWHRYAALPKKWEKLIEDNRARLDAQEGA